MQQGERACRCPATLLLAQAHPVHPPAPVPVVQRDLLHAALVEVSPRRAQPLLGRFGVGEVV